MLTINWALTTSANSWKPSLVKQPSHMKVDSRRECNSVGVRATLWGDRACRAREWQCDSVGARASLCGDCACRVHEMQARVRFVRCARNPLRRSCVECTKCRRECALSGSGATLCGDRACRVREMRARVRFARFRRNPLRRSCVSRAKCRRECVLETCRFTFGGNLVRNARFGDLPLHFWRKSRTKRACDMFASVWIDRVAKVRS